MGQTFFGVPIVMGGGVRLFGAAGAVVQNFDLVSCRRFESGVVIEEYIRTIREQSTERLGLTLRIAPYPNRVERLLRGARRRTVLRTLASGRFRCYAEVSLLMTLQW